MINIASADDRVFQFDPSTTALIVVDMQRDFVDAEGACAAVGADVKPLLAIVPRLQRVLARMRDLGATVVHTRYGFKADLSDLPESVRQQSRDAGGEYGQPGPLGRVLTQGEPGFEILTDLEPLDGEKVVDKASFGAFTNTDLDAYLKSCRITHVVIGGVTTQCCVEGTLREAVDRGYFVLTLEDGCAAFEQELHDSTMRTIQSEGHLFGWIASCDAFLNPLAEAAA